MFFLTQILCGQTGVLSTPQPDGATEPARILAVSDRAALDRFVPNEGVVELMFESLLQGLPTQPIQKKHGNNFCNRKMWWASRSFANQADWSGTRPVGCQGRHTESW